MLMGELEPDSGEIRRGTNVQIAYYDQQREQLDPERTVFDTVGEGNDTVTVNGKTQHSARVSARFSLPARARAVTREGALRGRADRLLLARLLTRPMNVLVLDERQTTSTSKPSSCSSRISSTGQARCCSSATTAPSSITSSPHPRLRRRWKGSEYVGGYEDWLRQRSTRKAGAETAMANPESPGAAKAAWARQCRRQKTVLQRKREIEDLPKKIEQMESEQEALHAKIAAPEFYKEPPDAIARALARIDELKGSCTTRTPAGKTWTLVRSVRL